MILRDCGPEDEPAILIWIFWIVVVLGIVSAICCKGCKLESTEIKVLDHGYVKFIESWGSDERIVESARISTNKGFLGWGPDEDGKPGDEKLLKYLYTHHHETPFEMAGLMIEVQAPIFVFREWVRHRTQSLNELSARYTPLPDFNYIPTIERLLLNSKTNNQASRLAGASELSIEDAEQFREAIRSSYEDAEILYKKYLAFGVPKELARIHLPVGRYSRMRASANLRNWIGFLKLRMDENAQWEIRQFANAVASLINKTFPRTYALFEESRSAK